MSLIKFSKLDKTEIAGDFKIIQCRNVVWVEEDGVMIGSKQFHRYVIAPNDDVSNESAEIKAIVNTAHTQKIKDAYTAFLATQEKI